MDRQLALTQGKLLTYKQAKTWLECSDLPTPAIKVAVTILYQMTGGNKWVSPKKLEAIQNRMRERVK